MGDRIIRAGKLDRVVTFQRHVAPNEFDSAGSGSWQTVATVRARVDDLLPGHSERMDEVVNIASRPSRIQIRFRTDISPDMRILYGARVMQIIAGPAEIGRRLGLELMAQDYSTQGNAA